MESPIKKKYTRSRLGCLKCKRKKKKCDQMKPKCGLCTKRNEDCKWPQEGAERLNNRRNKIRFVVFDSENPPLPISKQNADATSISTSDFQWNSSDSLSRESKSNTKYIDIRPFSPSPLELEMNQFYDNESGDSSINYCHFLDYTDIALSPRLVGSFSPVELPAPLSLHFFPIYKTPSHPLPIKLKDIENEYFDYYCNFVADSISVVPKQLNYFLKVFLPMAMEDVCVLYCLISWGCIFKNYRSDQILAKTSGMEFINTVLKELKKKRLDCKDEFIKSLTCYLILMCIEITTGDTNAWSKFLTNGYDLINKMGGFSILKGFSLEGKLLAENFAYFDILASQSNENGTYYPVYEYYNIFNMDDNSGFVDPLQGCIRPLILILGNVINLIVESKTLANSIIDSQLHCENLNSIFMKASELELLVKNAKPDPSDFKILNENDEMENHLQMFEIYQMTILIYIKQTIRRLPPAVPEIQLLLYEINKRLDILVETSVKSSLCFPLLVAGLNSVTKKDRQEVQIKIKKLMLHYEFDNIKKVQLVLEEVWKLNNNGTLCINWFDITKKFGWRLNIGR